MTRTRHLLAGLAFGLAIASVRAEFTPCERPFIFMNRRDVEAAKRRWKEPWARQAFEVSVSHGGGTDKAWPFHDAFRAMVLEDEAVAKKEKARLLSFIGADVSKTPPREDRLWDVMRYDMLYDRLTEEERKGVEDTFRKWIHYHLHEYWRGRTNFIKEEGKPPWDTRYTRVNWLPNMLYPRAQGIFMMALALQDEKLIRECFETPVGGFKWWMDHYVADRHFYMEEFKKQGSTFGELLLWCRACKQLGLDELGFGYVGQGDGPGHAAGASMKRYVEGWLKLGFPFAPAPEGGTPTYPIVYMGDAGPAVMIQGYAPGATEPDRRWYSARMNGPIPRMKTALWFEIAHAQWPGAGFDWVLAQMRMPKEDKYYPSLFFDLDPIDPAKVVPFPVASYVAPERGFGMLRMEESGKYWTSARPVATLQFGMQYVHYVHDCFTLMHYFAYRRPIYGRRAFGPHGGYGGDHPWVDSVRGHNGVVVDSMQIEPVDNGENGAQNTRVRHSFADHVKFLAIHAEPKEVDVRADQYAKETKKSVVALYPDVAVERALCLTDTYMLDVFNILSDRERTYHWNHHPHGSPQADAADAWTPTADFDGGKLFSNMPRMQKRHGAALKSGQFDLKNVHERDMGNKPWQLVVARGGDGPGVVIRMLGGQQTTGYRDVGQGVTTTIAERRAPKATFIVLHEPFKGKAQVTAFERVAETDEGVAVRIRGADGLSDRVLLAYGKHTAAPLTLGDGNEQFTFQGFGHVRVTDGAVLLTGDVRKIRLSVDGAVSAVRANGREIPATVREGMLTYESP